MPQVGIWKKILLIVIYCSTAYTTVPGSLDSDSDFSGVSGTGTASKASLAPKCENKI
jgi:hypothetical protein